MPTFRELAYKHTDHPEWHGFSLYDCIFPLFMFIAGVAIPYSFASHLARGQGSLALHVRVIRRGILLILLGLVINGILAFNFSIHFDQDVSGIKHLVTDFSHVRFPSVLGRIGIGYTFAALIVLHTRPRNQLLTAIGLLIGYWAASGSSQFRDSIRAACFRVRTWATSSIATCCPVTSTEPFAIRRGCSPPSPRSPPCSSA